MENGASSYLRFLNGDKEGFVELVEEYRNRLVLFIDSFVHDIHISEEAADNAFMSLYVKKPKYREG
nr:RNA polymerase subunit sigma-24 [Ruminococcus sp.]